LRAKEKRHLLKCATCGFLLGVMFSMVSLEGLPQRALPSSYPNLALITSEELQRFFEEAAVAFNIPSELLKAVGLVESGWDQAKRSKDGGFGIMQLTGATLTAAAKMLKECQVCGDKFKDLSLKDIEELLKRDSLEGAEANIWGGAAVLDNKWREVVNIGLTPKDADRRVLESWWFAITAYNGLRWHDNKKFVRSNYPFRVYNLFFNDEWRHMKGAEGKIPKVEITLPPNVQSIPANNNEKAKGLVTSNDSILEPRPPDIWYIRLTPTTPSAPSSLKAQRVSHEQIDLSWAYVPKLGILEGFKIYRRSAIPGEERWELVSTVGPNDRKFQDKGLNPRNRYCYQVRAFNTNGESNPSNEACPNSLPIANAGDDQTVQVGSPVWLDGSGSSDPDGDKLTCSWEFISKPRGSQARLSRKVIRDCTNRTNPSSPKPTFKADKVGDYVLELKVDDGRGGTATDQVKITATTDTNLFKENFEGDISGWTFTGFWHVQDNPQLVTNAYQGGCVTLPDNAHLPSATSGSKALWYGQATDGSFVGSNPDTISPGCTSSQPNSGTALSPMVDLTTASAASLKFQSWFEIESVDADRYDLMKIEVLNAVSDEALGCYLLNPSEDVNGPDNQPFTSGGFNSPAQWIQQSVDLNPFIGQKVRFRFTFDTRDRLYNGFRGWLIDDVVVSNQTAPTSSTLRACPGLGSASSNPRGLSGKDIIKNPSFNLSIKLDAVQFMADGPDIQEIQVRVFNLAGREVYNSGFVTGSRLYWNGLTNDGRRLANGVYLYVVRVRGFAGREYVSEVRKFVILR